MADFDKVLVSDGNLDQSLKQRTAGDVLQTSTSADEEESTFTSGEHKVVTLVNNHNYKIFDDAGNLEIRNKTEGFGIHIGKNGDIFLLSGSAPNGQLGGRICISAQKGQIVKSGPIITECTSDPQNQVQGEGSTTTSGSGKNEIARSDVNYGNWITETHGELRLKATNIVIDATDNLTLMGGSVTIQAGPNGGGNLKIQAGNISETTATRQGRYTSSVFTDGAAETTDVKIDPRASVNFISSGHMNVKSLGDFKLSAVGIGNVNFAGNVAPVGGVPLVKNRTSGFALGVKVGNLAISTKAGGVAISAASAFDKAIPASVAIKGKPIFLN